MQGSKDCSGAHGTHEAQGNWVLKPQLWRPLHARAHALQQEKPLQWEAWTLQTESSPHPQQLEKAHAQQKNTVQPKINKQKIKRNKVFKIQ